MFVGAPSCSGSASIRCGGGTERSRLRGSLDHDKASPLYLLRKHCHAAALARKGWPSYLACFDEAATAARHTVHGGEALLPGRPFGHMACDLKRINFS